MNKALFATTALVASLAASQVSANLVENGSFEDPNRTGGWGVYQSLPGWDVISGPGIEIQTNSLGIVTAQDGTQYVELDSHGGRDTNTYMAQELNNMVVGGHYELSFWYIPRTSRNNDNGIAAYFGGSQVALANDVRTSSSEWANFTLNVLADSSTMYLGFEALGIDNSVGGFLDNVSLTFVSEPAAYALFGLGLAGLVAARRRVTATSRLNPAEV